LHRGFAAIDPGVVEENVDSAVTLRYVAKRFLDGNRIGDVLLDAASVRPDFSGG
jgi:hypothetical protein